MPLPRNNLSVVISAPSGAGKTTLIKKLISVDPRFEFSVSTTTRPPREGEVNGESYHFMVKSDFLRMVEQGEFLEWASVHSNLYGTTKKEVDRISSGGRIPLFDVDVQGGRSLKEGLAEAVFIFIIPPSFGLLAERLTNRGTDSDEQIALRLGNALKEIREYDLYDYIVINDNLEESVETVRSIVTSELSKRERFTDIIHRILEEGNDYTSR